MTQILRGLSGGLSNLARGVATASEDWPRASIARSRAEEMRERERRTTERILEREKRAAERATYNSIWKERLAYDSMNIQSTRMAMSAASSAGADPPQQTQDDYNQFMAEYKENIEEYHRGLRELEERSFPTEGQPEEIITPLTVGAPTVETETLPSPSDFEGPSGDESLYRGMPGIRPVRTDVQSTDEELEPSARRPVTDLGSGITAGYTAAGRARGERNEQRLRREIEKRALDSVSRRGRAAGLRSYEAGYYQTFSRVPTKEEINRFLEQAVGFAPPVAAELEKIKNDLQTKLQNKDLHPKQALENLRLSLDLMRAKGRIIPQQIEDDIIDLITNFVPPVQLSPRDRTILHENLKTQGLITDVLGALTRADGSLNPHTTSAIGLIAGQWSKLRMRLMGDLGDELDVTEEEAEALFALQMLNQRMGRDLTGAAIQSFEQTVFDLLFGSSTRAPKAIVVSLRKFQAQIQRDYREYWDLIRRPENLAPETMDEDINNIDFDKLFETSEPDSTEHEIVKKVGE
jgi:hypothetical protein